jgi:hypothetical protein
VATDGEVPDPPDVAAVREDDFSLQIESLVFGLVLALVENDDLGVDAA